jgi:hypothetical protein
LVGNRFNLSSSINILLALPFCCFNYFLFLINGFFLKSEVMSQECPYQGRVQRERK